MSNLYADRISSEHPSLLFPLDDPATHISLVSEDNRRMSLWSGTNCNLSDGAVSSTGGAPFQSSWMTKVEPSGIGFPTVGGETMTISSPAAMFNSGEIYSTIPVSATIHVWLPSNSIELVKFGSDLTNTDEYDTYSIPPNFHEGWIDISTSKINVSTGEIQIEFVALEGQSSGHLGVYMNGLNVGQYAETRGSSSLGSDKSLSLVGAYPNENVPPLRNGWYVVEDHRLLAYNDSIPMAYGSNHCTRLLASTTGAGSMEFPALGFWNESGKWNSMSVEFWLRISGLSDGPRKIFGPRTDQVPEQNSGLYVDGSTMSLSVNGNIASANVGIMSSPMLIHILQTDTFSSLMINGEEILTVRHDIEKSVLSTLDWLLFYTYPEFECFEIDCFSLFPYLIPSVVAKRRFVWGQGVDNIGTVNARNKGSTAQANFAEVGVGSNVMYPNNASWASGKSVNLDVINDRIGVVPKALPNLFLGDKTIDDWNSSQTSPLISFDIAGYEDIHPYMSFEKLSDYANNPESINVIWETAALLSPGVNNSLFAVSSKRNPDMFIKAYLDDDVLNVDFIDGADTLNVYSSSVLVDTKYITVLDFNSTRMEVGHVPQRMSTMLSNTEDLEFVVGSVGDETFNGLFHSVSISSNYETSVVDNHKSVHNFDHSVMLPTESQLYDISTYTVVATSDYGFYHLDIAQRGHWSDYIPLSTLTSTATNVNGDDELGVDQIQFNLGYPKSLAVNVSDEYDTVGNHVRAFVSFQRANRLLLNINELSEKIPATSSDVVYTDDIDNVINKRIEVVDGTTIIVPRGYRVEDLSLSLYLEIVTPGSNDRPISIKTMEFAGYNLSKTGFTGIGTKTGKSIYPHANNGYYYDFNASNPFRIDKRGFPHLYLGIESGFVPAGDRTPEIDRGMTINMPETNNQEYLLDILQFWVRAGNEFPSEPEDIFLFEYGNEKIRVRLSQYPGDASRGILTAFDKGMNRIPDVKFRQNGHSVKRCVLSKNQWAAIDLSFDFPITLDATASRGFIKIYPGLVYNNISYFSPSHTPKEVRTIHQSWEDIYGGGANIWSDWSSMTWREVYSSGFITVRKEGNSSNVYESAIGTNREVFLSSSPLTLSQGSGKTIDAAIWQSVSAIPT